MTEPATGSRGVHRWYMRPVLLVVDLDRALRFYIPIPSDPEWIGDRPISGD